MDQYQQTEEQEIDLLELAQKLWRRRKTFYKVCGIAVVVALVIAYSIPKEYTVTVTLSPESGESGSGSLGGIASMMGMNLGSGNDADALNITLFPDILSSNPFALELYEMPVTVEDEEELKQMPLNEYIVSQQSPWWSWIMSLPGKAIGGILSLFKDEEEAGERVLDPFRLTRGESLKLGAIKSSMTANVDKKTGVTTITVTLQDPVVAATVADSVVRKLQDYVTDYRTRKAIDDSKYWEKLYQDRQAEYYAAQQAYASYVDENKSLYTRRSQVEGERLQNDMNLAYQVYSQTAQQLQLVRGKIQEAKPVFAVVNPATVPITPSAPRKLMILVGIVFLAFCGTAGWILFGEDTWRKMREATFNQPRN